MLKSDVVSLNFDYSEFLFRPEDLCALNGAQLNADGSRLEVPPAIEDYISYGPYTQLPSGVYYAEVYIDFLEHNSQREIRFEVLSAGSILCDCLFQQGKRSTFTINEPSGDLEFRVKADGRPFALLGISIKPAEIRHSERLFLKSESSTEGLSPQDLEIHWQLLNRKFDNLKNSGETINVSAISEKLLDQWEDGFAKFIEFDLSTEELLQRSALDLRYRGLSISALRLARTDNAEEYSHILRQYDYTTVGDSLAMALNAREAQFSSTFLRSLSSGDGVEQYTSAKWGSVFCPCPYTGEMLVSRHAFVVANDRCIYLLYRFEGVCVFYVACGSFHNRRAFMFLPQSNILIHLSSAHQFWGGAADTIKRLKVSFVTCSKNIIEYLSNDTTPVLMSGTIDNLGHFLWNELSGAFRFSRNGLLDKIHEGVAYKFNFLDTFQQLGLTDLKVHRFGSAAALFDGMLANRFFPVLPTSLRVHPDTASAIIKRSLREISYEEQHLIRQARQSSRLIFFTLRVHNKSWVEQCEGVLEIANRSVADGVSTSIYLDGMADCADLVSEIKNNAPETVLIYSGIGKPMAATIAWAAACDAYVVTVGSGLTILTWIAGKPGVAHSEHHHLTQRTFWSEVRMDVPAPTFVDEADVRELGIGSYGNYSLSPQRVSELLWPLLETDGAVSTAAPAVSHS